eukprot:TRINITY_DN2355_c0_g1_i1.p1 TRINITY_DN2355_c0_g1~~TRINITY_DN2355_c0_g1_i1.p1  ORF type:complete len:354 (+),score=166.00 TRINITY_DN2355_c0_g1_i1:80-1063(+)
MADDGWCTIESDPGVFTELIQSIGVEDAQLEEVYCLDESLEKLQPVYGLVFLFKWLPEEANDTRPVITDYDPSKLFFAKQVINNACATQAILSVLMNAADLDIGPELTDFRNFTVDFPPEMKGLAISNSDRIRLAHNSFARPEPFVAKTKKRATKDDDVYHFVSYVHVGDSLYELDGLKEGPIFLGKCTKETWLEAVRPAIHARIEKYAQNEIRFNLMAVIKNQKKVIAKKIEDLQQRRDQALASGAEGSAMNDDNDGQLSSSSLVAQIDFEIEDAKGLLQAEEEKFRRWKVENTRRKHNYIPFIVNLLRYLADKDLLFPLIEESKK